MNPTSTPVGRWTLPRIDEAGKDGKLLYSHHGRRRMVDINDLERMVKQTNTFFEGFKRFQDGKVKVAGIRQGATATQFILELAPGVTVKDLKSLQDDIALRLRKGVLTLNEGVISIDVPAADHEVGEVTILDLLEDPKVRSRHYDMPIVLGRTLEGEPLVVDLQVEPHMIVGGQTGKGKSTFLLAVLQQLLIRFSPEYLRLTIIDPKREFAIYSGIPHLEPERPVTDMQEAAALLQELDQERDARQKLLEELKIHKWPEYIDHCRRKGEPVEHPYRIVIIDETALFITGLSDKAPRGVSSARELAMGALERLVASSRSAGIHIILATQRPTNVNLTKQARSQLSVRVAFAVNDGLDSAQILGEGIQIAASLRARGEAYVINEAGQFRMRGAYVTPAERDHLISFWKAQVDEDD